MCIRDRCPVPPRHQVAQPRPGEVHQRGRRLPRRHTGSGVGPVRERLGRTDQGLREPGHLPLGKVRVAVGLAGGVEDQLRHERHDLRPHRGDLGGEHLSVRTRLEMQHRPAVGVPRGVREERGQARPELAVRGQPRPDPRAHRLGEGPRLPADARGEEVLLRVEVQVHQRLGHARQFGDLVHRRGHVPPLPEGPYGGVQHLLFTDRTRHPLRLHGTHGTQRTVTAATAGRGRRHPPGPPDRRGPAGRPPSAAAATAR